MSEQTITKESNPLPTENSITKTVQKIKKKRTRKKKSKPVVPCPSHVFVVYKTQHWMVRRKRCSVPMAKSKTTMLIPLFKSEQEAQQNVEKRKKKIKQVWDGYEYVDIPVNPNMFNQHTYFEIKKLRLKKSEQTTTKESSPLPTENSITKTIQKIKKKRTRKKKSQPVVPCPSHVFVVYKTQEWMVPRRRGCCVLIAESKKTMLSPLLKSEEEAQQDIEKRKKKIKKVWDGDDDEYVEKPIKSYMFSQHTYFEIKKLRLKK